MRGNANTAEQAEDGMDYVNNMNVVYKQMGQQDAMESAVREKTAVAKPTGSFFGFGKKKAAMPPPSKSSKMDDSFSNNLF